MAPSFGFAGSLWGKLYDAIYEKKVLRSVHDSVMIVFVIEDRRKQS
jgi:hypothetical protein